VLNFAPIADVALRAKYASALVHDVDAIATFDANAQAANSTVVILPSKGLIFWQGPTVTLTSSGGAHSVTVEAIVHGLDARGLPVAIPVKFDNVSLSSTTPIARPIGYALAEVNAIVYVTKTGIAAGDTFNCGYDLNAPVVLLAEEVFAAANLTSALEKVASGLAAEARHQRWTTGQPTPTVNKLVIVTTPPWTNG